MDTKSNNLRYLWLAIAAVLGFFIGGRLNLPLVAWVAPIFALRFFRQSDRPWRDLFLFWLVSALSTIVSWQGATSMRFIHPMAEPFFFLLTGLIGLLPYVIDRAYFRRFGAAFWLVLVYPLAAAGMDFFSSSGSPFGTFGAGSYSQREFLPAMQLASVLGLWGLPFAMALFASAVNDLWDHGIKRLSLVFVGVVGLVLLFGFVRVATAPVAEKTVPVAGFSLPNGKLSDVMDYLQNDDERKFRQVVDETHAAELTQIRALAQKGAKIVVLQEGAGMGYADQVEKLLRDAGQVAVDENIYIVLPTFTFGIPVPENILYILDAQGKVVLRHIKYGGNQFEGSLKGDGVLQTVQTPYGKLSAVICWDADFPEVLRQAGAQDVELLFVPANDWLEVRDIHAGMSTFRGVENGLTIFRQTGQGVSLVSDAYGREFSRVDSFAEAASGPFAAVQLVNTPIKSVQTFYPQLGDVFGALMQLPLAVLFLGMLGLWVQGRFGQR